MISVKYQKPRLIKLVFSSKTMVVNFKFYKHKGKSFMNLLTGETI